MTINTLKELIDNEFDKVETISQFKAEVFRLIDLYMNDNRLTIKGEDIKEILQRGDSLGKKSAIR